MKQVIAIVMIIAALAVVQTASAQKKSKVFSFGFGFEGGLVNGDLKDVYHTAAGITLRASVHAGPGFITLTSGAVAYIPQNIYNDDVNAGVQVPIKFGYKYIFLKHVFIMAEAGYSSFTFYTLDNNGDNTKMKDNGFTIAPAAGVQFGALELAVRYESTSVSNGTLSMTALRIGFNF